MKAIGYIRVSTEEQTNGVSLEAQEAKIQAWCTLHDAELVAIYRDEGISGYKGRDSRPGLDTAGYPRKAGHPTLSTTSRHDLIALPRSRQVFDLR